MMMFRRLYWVAEQVDNAGRSKVTGVYTSIQDLVQRGLRWCDGSNGPGGYRLTMVKPDCFNCPLGMWESPRFEGMAKDLEEFVENDEYSREEVATLEAALQQFTGPHARAS